MNLLPNRVVLSAVLGLSVVGALSLTTCGGGGGGSSSGFKMCGTSNSTCTAAETNTYNNCVTTACDGTFKECYGAGYKSGSFSGPCGPYITCQNACACGDSACVTACGIPSESCISCSISVGNCSQTCTPPACASGGGTGGSSGAGTGGSSGAGTGGSSGAGTGGAGAGGTCADLLACCNATTNAQLMQLCMQQYTAVMSMGDATCGQILAALQGTYCP